MVIKGDGGEIILAPFAEAELSSEDLTRVNQGALRRSPYVAVLEPTAAPDRESGAHKSDDTANARMTLWE
jgi:hypothetical protein